MKQKSHKNHKEALIYLSLLDTKGTVDDHGVRALGHRLGEQFVDEQLTLVVQGAGQHGHSRGSGPFTYINNTDI